MIYLTRAVTLVLLIALASCSVPRSSTSEQKATPTQATPEQQLAQPQATQAGLPDDNFKAELQRLKGAKLIPLKAQDKAWLEDMIAETDKLDHAFASSDHLVYIEAAGNYARTGTATLRPLPDGLVLFGYKLMLRAYIDIDVLYQIDLGNEPESERAKIIERWDLQGTPREELPMKVYLAARQAKLTLTDLVRKSPIEK